MPGNWSSSNRRSELPHNWSALRNAVRARANDQCEAHDDGERCTRTGTECDHRNDPDDHSMGNLQWLCHDHHAAKTQAEAQAAAARQRAKLTRPQPAHPGISQH